MRGAATFVLCAALAALAGCGGDEDEERTASGLAREAAQVVEDLERALASGDYERICADLLSAEVRRQVGGGDCPAALERTSAGVRRPRIEVRNISIKNSTASVEVVTTAVGQARVEDTIRLVRESGRFRISSLSG